MENKGAEAAEVNQELEEIKSLLWETGRYNFNQMDEVFPGIFVGGLQAAMNVNLLSTNGITHILNSALETFGEVYVGVKTNPEYYKIRNFPCEFLAIPAIDYETFELHPFFEESTEFIDRALKCGGKVLVHCFMGISRSATLTICYLMIKKQFSASDAIKLVLAKRSICPNDGFLKQLYDLEARLNEQK